METFYQDGKGHLGLDEYRMRNAEAIQKHWWLVFVAYAFLHLDCLPLVTDKRELARQNHWGSVSSASPSSYPGVDPLCPRATPAWAAGGNSLCFFIRQATTGPGEMSVHLDLPKTQQSSWGPVRHRTRPSALCGVPDRLDRG